MPSKPTHREYWDSFFDAEVAKESPRASVILAAAMLEQALEALLRAHLVPLASQSDPLFDGPYAPLGTFSAKIDVAFRIALVPSRVTRDLHLVRKIRNDFAHNVTGCTFDDAMVRSRILELTRSQGVTDAVPKVRARYPKGATGDFQMTVSWMLWYLWTRAEQHTPLMAFPEMDRLKEITEEPRVIDSPPDGKSGGQSPPAV